VDVPFSSDAHRGLHGSLISRLTESNRQRPAVFRDRHCSSLRGELHFSCGRKL